MDGKELEKIVNYIFDRIIFNIEDDLDQEQIVKLLLSLEDSNGNRLLSYEYSSINSVILDDNSKKILSLIIEEFKKRKKVLLESVDVSKLKEELEELEIYISETEIDPSEWSEEELKDLIEEKNALIRKKEELEKKIAGIEQTRSVYEKNDVFRNLDNIEDYLSRIKDREISIPSVEMHPVTILCDYGILYRDLDVLGTKGNRFKAVSTDMDQMVRAIQGTYDPKIGGFNLYLVSSVNGTGIHSYRPNGKKSSDVWFMYKDVSNDIRVIIVPDSNDPCKFYIRGIVRGHKNEAERKKRFRDAYEGNNIGHERVEDFDRFCSFVKNRYFRDLTNPIIQYLDVIAKKVLEDEKRREDRNIYE